MDIIVPNLSALCQTTYIVVYYGRTKHAVNLSV